MLLQGRLPERLHGERVLLHVPTAARDHDAAEFAYALRKKYDCFFLERARVLGEFMQESLSGASVKPSVLLQRGHAVRLLCVVHMIKCD